MVPRISFGEAVWPLRRIIEAILYVDRAGCAWRYLPEHGEWDGEAHHRGFPLP